ncbi:hypothetical protein HJB61_26535 [Rhizobium lentis]|nr:hypothetical protein [Rhizobium lentis]
MKLIFFFKKDKVHSWVFSELGASTGRTLQANRFGMDFVLLRNVSEPRLDTSGGAGARVRPGLDRRDRLIHLLN